MMSLIQWEIYKDSIIDSDSGVPIIRNEWICEGECWSGVTVETSDECPGQLRSVRALT